MATKNVLGDLQMILINHQILANEKKWTKSAMYDLNTNYWLDSVSQYVAVVKVTNLWASKARWVVQFMIKTLI